MGKQCMLCFKYTDTLQPVVKGAHAQVCKACGYKVNQVVGFLEYHKVTITYQPDLFETPPTPPTPGKTTKPPKKG